MDGQADETPRFVLSRSQPRPARPLEREADELTALAPSMPTLLATRLQLELILSDRSVDLGAAAGIILNDVGATLEIFRRAGEEGVAAERVEDCLAALGTEVWMEAVCGSAVERIAADPERLSELIEFWEHSRLLAYACWFIASHMEGVCADEAYLVGLMHEADRLPYLLDWTESWAGAGIGAAGQPDSAWSEEKRASVGMMAQFSYRWRLPVFLREMLEAIRLPEQWEALLATAHAWSRGEDCLLGYRA